MLTLTIVALWAAAPAKLAPATAKEMADAVVAVDKALGMESWPSRGVKPCVDRGGPENPTKDVKAADARGCASSAGEKGLPNLGKSYVVAVLMAPVGPVTVAAFGIGDAEGWAA